jgi:catechol 2,3-dioxygenase-like lactoylglutathione lyase family enzyme
MWTSLDHVILAVRDLDLATGRMARLLGRRPSWRGSHPAWGTANALFRLANTTLELLAPIGRGALASCLEERLERQGEGLAGLAFGTEDAAATAAELRARGVESGPPEKGLGRDDESGAWREWRTLTLPPAVTRGAWLFGIQPLSPPDVLPPSTPLGVESAAVTGLDHVVVASPDLDGARHLYGELLGLRLALDRSFEARGLRMLFFRVGGVTLEVVGRLGVPADRGAPDRLDGLAWRTPDVDAARARLAAAEIEVSEVRPGFKPGTRVCTVRGGTCGVPTLLIGPDPVAPRPLR